MFPYFGLSPLLPLNLVFVFQMSIKIATRHKILFVFTCGFFCLIKKKYYGTSISTKGSTEMNEDLFSIYNRRMDHFQSSRTDHFQLSICETNVLSVYSKHTIFFLLS